MKLLLRRVIPAGVLIFVTACASRGQRVLSQEEAQRHGLTAIIYDAPLCPNKFKNGTLQVDGPCEDVTCEYQRDKLVCIARKRPGK